MEEKKKGIAKMVIMSVLDAFKTTPFSMLALLISSIASGGLLVMITYVEQHLYDSITMFAVDAIQLHVVIKWIVIVALVYISQQIFVVASNISSSIFSGKAIGGLSLKLYKKIAELPSTDFEDVDKLNELNKVSGGMGSVVGTAAVVINMIAFDIPYFIFMELYLIGLDEKLGFAMLFVFIPTIVTNITRAKVFGKLEDETVLYRRKKDYYAGCICSDMCYKEVRLLGLHNFFKEKYHNIVDKLMNVSYKAKRKVGIVEMFITMITVLGYGMVIGLLVDSVIRGSITVGAFAAVFTSISKIYDILNSMITQKIGGISSSYVFMKNYYNFMCRKQSDKEYINLPGDRKVILKNVSFKYPGQIDYAIKDVNLIIESNQSVALVGENGSGKSTLTKIITGLYEPTEGTVYVSDSTETEKYDLSTISSSCKFDNVSSVFQRFGAYTMTLQDNIMLSQFTKAWDEQYVESISKEIDLCLDGENFIHGYKTMIGREFGGIELSLGQWQRIAILRGIYRDCEMIVLDEPTAAIDPMEENRLYRQFVKITREKMGIVVTHRLGATRNIDRILVIDNGKIIEDGNHDELMLKHGKYEQMFKAQEQWYV